MVQHASEDDPELCLFCREPVESFDVDGEEDSAAAAYVGIVQKTLAPAHSALAMAPRKEMSATA
jgi:hypothetical protein